MHLCYTQHRVSLVLASKIRKVSLVLASKIRKVSLVLASKIRKVSLVLASKIRKGQLVSLKLQFSRPSSLQWLTYYCRGIPSRKRFQETVCSAYLSSFVLILSFQSLYCPYKHFSYCDEFYLEAGEEKIRVDRLASLFYIVHNYSTAWHNYDIRFTTDVNLPYHHALCSN